MTNPSDPGRPEGSAEGADPARPGPPPGAYGPPPRPAGPAGPGGPWPNQPPGGPGAPGPRQPPPGWVPQPRPADPEYSSKGFFAALFDVGFDHMVTIKIIRLFYILVMVLTGVTALTMLLFAWSFSEWNGALAFATVVATPIVALFQIVVTRMLLEFVINQFKITEELRKIREGGRLRP